MNTKQLRQKILDLAIRGQLVPQDSSDEPASVLLEKIRAEKQTLIEQKKIKKDKKSSYITCDLSPYQKYTEHFADGTSKDITDEIPFEIPENWVWCNLEQICEFITDGTHQTPKYSESGYIFLSSKNVTTGKINWEEVKYISEELHNILYKRVSPKLDDILLAKNGTTGVAAIVDKDIIFDIYVSLAILRPFKKYINSKYLLYIINSSTTKNQFNKGLKGIGVPNLHLEQIRKVIFPLPPLSEQRRIVEKIEELLALVDDLETNKTDLQSYIKQTKSKVLEMAIRGKLVPQNPNDEPASVLLERIKKEQKPSKSKSKTTEHNTHHEEELPFDIPENWVWCRLGEVCDFENGFAFSSDNYCSQGVPLIRISNIQNSKIDLKDVVFVDKIVDEKFIVEKGDLLIAMSGATTGKMGNYTFEEKAYLNQRVGNIRIKFESILYPKYRDFFMLTKSNDVLKMAYGGAQPNISGKMIESLLLPLPPLAEQHRIVEKIEHIFAVLEELEENIL